MQYFTNVYWSKGEVSAKNQDSALLLQALTARGRILMAGLAAVFAVIALCNEILQKLHINGNVEDFSFARNGAWIAVGMVIVCVGCLGISIKSSEHIMEKMEEF